jgi:hypothetical protein
MKRYLVFIILVVPSSFDSGRLVSQGWNPTKEKLDGISLHPESLQAIIFKI